MNTQTISMSNSGHCILCNTANFRIIYRKEQWQYHRCLNCSLVSLYPRPAKRTLLENYEDYLPVQPEEIKKWGMMMKPIVLRSADLIESGSKSGKGNLLDIGCGYGFFLQEMKSRGWQVEGIEVSRAGRRYARDKWHVPVHSRPIEDLGLPENAFDVVTLFYVIEHVLDPPGLLAEVKRVLKPGGLIFLRWPHSTPIVRILGPLSRRLDLYHTPYHLYDFSSKTIDKLLVLSGFCRIQTMIGGYTRPSPKLARWASTAFGQLGEALYFLSCGNILLPGVSKTTLAVKKE